MQNSELFKILLTDGPLVGTAAAEVRKQLLNSWSKWIYMWKCIFYVLFDLLYNTIEVKTYKAPVTMKSATGAVQMQIKMKIMLWNNDEIMMKLS